MNRKQAIEALNRVRAAYCCHVRVKDKSGAEIASCLIDEIQTILCRINTEAGLNAFDEINHS